VGGLDVILKMILYYFHERTWNRVVWGKARVKPFVLWLTGLPGSGKSTLAAAMAKKFQKLDIKFEQLDGDVVRNIFPNTGFSKEERNMHIRRVGFLAGFLRRNGVPVICSFVSPYREPRKFVRKETRHFIEVYINTPLEVCEKRDPKGLYQKARKGEIKQFTGIDDPYEEPENSELRIDTTHQTVEESTHHIFSYLRKKGYIA